jgi:hypothetical protein
MDHCSNDNEIDDEDLPLSHPARRIRRRADDGVSGIGAWQGEEMELEHQRETERRDRTDRDESSTTGAAAIVTAVDLNQFRNTEVGKGYQAKHVVRQKNTATNNDTAAAAAAQVIIDAETMVPASTKKRRSAAAAARMERRAENDTAASTVAVVTEKEELLRNDGLRLFRREIENILSP